MSDIIGYRRVFDGGCDHCAVASERLYGRGDLAPLHDNCNCGILPVFKGEDHGLFTGKPGHEYQFVKDGKLGPTIDQSKKLGSPYRTKEEIDAEFKDWFENLDDDGLGALSQYIGSDSFRLNNQLRSGVGHDYDDLRDELGKNMKPLDEDTRVYRGIGDTWQSVFGHEPQVGGRITDQGFLSTSLERIQAENFGIASEDYNQGVLIEIIATKGTPAAWIGGEMGGESEMLLTHGLTLEILKVIGPDHIICKVVS